MFSLRFTLPWTPSYLYHMLRQGLWRLLLRKRIHCRNCYIFLSDLPCSDFKAMLFEFWNILHLLYSLFWKAIKNNQHKSQTCVNMCFFFLYLFWYGGHCCPMHCDLFKIYCASPNLGIRTWICRLNFARGLFFQAWVNMCLKRILKIK